MQSPGPQSSYESYCYSCNVSAPPDAKRCVHCGGRLSRQRGVPPEVSASPFEGPSDAGQHPSPGALISPMTVLWILLFIGGTLYRMCS